MIRLPFNYQTVRQQLVNRKWTPELSKQWQEYYNTAPRLSVFASAGQLKVEPLGLLPKYKDFQVVQCQTK